MKTRQSSDTTFLRRYTINTNIHPMFPHKKPSKPYTPMESRNCNKIVSNFKGTKIVELQGKPYVHRHIQQRTKVFSVWKVSFKVKKNRTFLYTSVVSKLYTQTEQT